jgi:hypothetical protein
MKGRPAGELSPIEHEDVGAARDRQVIRDAAAGDAAADDDDASGTDGWRPATRR